MEYRRLGKTGLKVSELCMGTMQFGWTADEPTSFQILSAAFESGMNFIDTADIYTRWVEGNPGGVSEGIVGRWIKSTDIPRDQIIVATKVRGPMGPGPNDSGLSRAHIMRAVDDSLRRMQLDHIDLYQTHSPDDDTPIDETLRALDDLVSQGKVRYIGCSNYPGWRLLESHWRSDSAGIARFDRIQPHYNLVNRAEFERELMPACETYQIGVIPYSPLAGGFLTQKYRRNAELPDSARAANVAGRYDNPASWDVRDRAAAVAEDLGKSISQIALAWQLRNPVITSPIIGPRTLEQLEDNTGAIGMRLSAEHMKQLAGVGSNA